MTSHLAFFANQFDGWGDGVTRALRATVRSVLEATEGATVQPAHYKDADALSALVSEQFSEWSPAVTVTQDMINTFAELSGDHMWMHVDVARCAAESPFGKPIAHGFLLLSLVSRMPTSPNILEQVTGFKNIMNYGSDKLRFMQPVTVDSAVHARSRVCEIDVGDKRTKVTLEMEIQAVGADRPAVLYHLSFVFL